MSEETKHTPTPWHWVNPETDEPRKRGESRCSLRSTQEFGKNETIIKDGKSYTSFSLPIFLCEAEDISDEDAEFIVKAVNSYAAHQEEIAKYKETIKELLFALAYEQEDGEETPFQVRQKAILKALAKASAIVEGEK